MPTSSSPLRLLRIWSPTWTLVLAVLLGVMLARLPLQLAVGLIGGTAALLLIFIQPLVGLAMALLLGPLGALENVLLGNAFLDSGQLVLLITIGAWIGRGLLHRNLGIPSTFLNLPLLLFIYVTLFTLLSATSIVTGLREVVKWLEIALIMLMVVDLGQVLPEAYRTNSGDVAAPTRHKWILAILLLAGLSQALIGIWQFGLRGTGPEHFIILGRFYRAYGTFEQPNPFGGFMNLTALLAMGALVGLGMACWRKYRANRIDEECKCGYIMLPVRHLRSLAWFLFAGGCALATILALIFSWSRGAWLGFGAGIVVFVLALPRRWWLGPVLLLIAGGIFLASLYFNLIPADVTSRISNFGEDLSFGDVRGVDINDANYAVLERLAHWQAAIDMARDHLWLGIGFGNYEPAYADYALINWPYPLGHAHNYYLNLLAETGVLGLTAYLIFWVAVFYRTVRLLRRLEWPERGVIVGLLATWVALSVHHLVDKLYVNNIYIHLGVMLGLLQLLDREQKGLTFLPLRLKIPGG